MRHMVPHGNDAATVRPRVERHVGVETGVQPAIRTVAVGRLRRWPVPTGDVAGFALFALT